MKVTTLLKGEKIFKESEVINEVVVIYEGECIVSFILLFIFFIIILIDLKASFSFGKESSQISSLNSNWKVRMSWSSGNLTKRRRRGSNIRVHSNSHFGESHYLTTI